MRLYVLFLVLVAAAACSGGSSDGAMVEPFDAGGTPPDANAPCVAESNAELCQLANLSCGTATRVDRCGNSRTVNCGVCESDACAQGEVTSATCAVSDPCGWSGDGYCDIECQQAFPDSHFDDGDDCVTISSSLGTSCTDNSDCAAELTCTDGTCGCCNDAEEVSGQWDCHVSLVPAIAQSVCGVTRASTVADLYGQAALDSVGVGCYSGSANNHWCPPQLQCVSRVEADEYRCGCCADVQGSFMCSYNVEFARTFCLGLSTSCLDGSCLDCIGPDCEPECASNSDGVCDEPEGTGLCPNGTDFSDCSA